MNTKPKAISTASEYFDRTQTDYQQFCFHLKQMIEETIAPSQPILFLCIGSDRITGDCLGPLVGHKLKKAFPSYPYIFGTLKNPVHALNMEHFLNEINELHFHPACIAIDASLGCNGHVGCITLSRNPLLPGEGVKKNLPQVGDISITGIVNTIYGNPGQKLQETRLFLVNELADFISGGICDCLSSRLSF